MKLQQQIKNHLDGWDLGFIYPNQDEEYEKLIADLSKIARLYAEAKCKEQREICAAHSEVWIVDQEELHQKEDILGVGVYEKSILNAPAPNFD